MKYQAALLSGAVVLSAAISSVAAVTYFNRSSLPIIVDTPAQTTDLQPAKPAPSSVPTVPQSPQQPSATLGLQSSDLTDFPQWRINLVDESSQSPDFAQFLEKVKQAVRDRDAEFIRSIVTPKTKLGFGEHRSISYLNPENPQSPFWMDLEKSLALGCTNEQIFFSCPTAFRQFDGAIKDAPADQKALAYETSVIVVGENVNVRSQPDSNAPLVAILSNEIVKFDRDTFKQAMLNTPKVVQQSDLNAWTPVILPNDKSGYVSNRYAYNPLGYRVLFAKENGKWIMQAFVVGD
ncbi:MAG: SH3 domain-containing protein [Myxacorys californica WJT36-NPBG1]|jgi:hypothetical protein|nr:SH3 domain-containing protein [Myxacorys californica WJT36-NPBG1]